MVIKGDWTTFLGLKGEELYFVKRRHIFTLLYPTFIALFLTIVFVITSYFIFSIIIVSLPLFIVSLFLILSIAMSITTYTLIYWYFHLYVLTSRKLLEVWYTPLFSHVVNDVFLDKVNCTEIDVSSKGFLHELIDMGDVTITFDRPTHEEEFVIRDVKNCDELAKYLTQKIMDTDRKGAEETIWLRDRHRIFPKAAV